MAYERRAHTIKKNARNEMPRFFVFFDTETKEGMSNDDGERELTLKLGAATFVEFRKDKVYGKKDFFFYIIKDFWDTALSFIPAKSKIYFVAHNVAFDMRVLKGFHVLKERGFILEKYITSGTTCIWNFRKESRTICFLDNMNFFKSSLKTLGHSIGIEKTEMPTASYRELLKYCRNDVKIMLESWKLLFSFLKGNDLGNFSKTIASQALSAYRHRFMKNSIFIHTNKNAIALERESYHGGRTECFFIGTAPRLREYFLVDVNSMYPSVMREMEYPTKLVRYTEKASVRTLEMYLKNYCITARVYLDVPENVFCMKEKKLIFPVGKFHTTLTTRELEYALKHNYILDVYQMAIYEKKILFESYVNFFYNKKLEYKKAGNEAFTYICKLFLNSLYGKFGQRNDVFEKTSENKERDDGFFKYFDVDISQWITQRTINGITETSRGQIEAYDSFVAIAAHITADARMKLWKYFKIAGMENIFYCDTDSMILNMRGYLNCKKYLDDEALGMLSLKEHSSNLKIHGAKDYEFSGNTVIKGISKNAKMLSHNVFSQTRFEGMAGALRKGRTDKMFISTTTKTLSRKYDKGERTHEGRIVPYRVNNSPRLF